LTVNITGSNIGYIYIFSGYLDKSANSLFIADTDYLQSGNSKQAQGVYYPDWGSKASFKLQFAWEPIVFAISDGKTSVVTMLKPEQFGASPEQATYSVDGIYTFAGGGSTRNARLYFANGTLIHAFVFTGDTDQSTDGAPWEITPQAGDTFTVLEQWLDLNANGQPVTPATQKGKTLTFGQSTLTWKEMDAAAGDYAVGFIVEDLDGNKYEAYSDVSVK
jgi:hypothetical protein